MAKRTPDAAGSSRFEQDQPAASVDWSADAFPSRSHSQALAAVAAALGDGAACLLVTGVSGIGKTTLCRALVSSGGDRTFATAVLDPRLSTEDVLAQLLRDFGLLTQDPHAASHDRDELLSAVGRFLVSLKPLAAHALLVVDDAERISGEVLQTLHDVSRAADPSGQLLRLVLIGQPSLEARLHEPALQSLGASVRAHVSLLPLDRDEIIRYVSHRSKVGADGTAALTETRLSEVHDQSEGIPARVNFFIARALQAETAPAASFADLDPPDETAAPDVPAPTEPASRRIAVLTAALVLVAAGAWWWTQPGAAPEAPTNQTPATEVQGEASRPAGPPPPIAPGSAAPSTAGPETSTAPAGRPSGPTASTAPGGAEGLGSAAYRITVASFRTASRAAAVASQLQQRNITVTTRVDPSGAWHQVIAGPFSTIEAARDAQRALTATGFPETQITTPPAPRSVEGTAGSGGGAGDAVSPGGPGGRDGR